MASMSVRRALGALLAGSLIFSSTAAAASAIAAPSANAQPNPWAVLAAMSEGAPAAAMCGAAATVAASQVPGGCVLPALDAPPPPPVAAQPPPPPPVEMASGAGFNPLLLGLLAIAAGVGLAFAVGSGHHNRSNSPA